MSDFDRISFDKVGGLRKRQIKNSSERKQGHLRVKIGMKESESCRVANRRIGTRMATFVTLILIISLADGRPSSSNKEPAVQQHTQLWPSHRSSGGIQWQSTHDNGKTSSRDGESAGVPKSHAQPGAASPGKDLQNSHQGNDGVDQRGYHWRQQGGNGEHGGSSAWQRYLAESQKRY
jgi:hypothetical protein